MDYGPALKFETSRHFGQSSKSVHDGEPNSMESIIYKNPETRAEAQRLFPVRRKTPKPVRKPLIPSATSLRVPAERSRMAKSE
jgi:hypothetical protein